MKFVALALALLLAVGSQAVSLPADAPSQLEHVRAAGRVYLGQTRDTLKSAMTSALDNTEYAEYKDRVAARLDAIHDRILEIQATIGPVTDSALETIKAATEDYRMRLTGDWEALKTSAGPKAVALRRVLEEHYEEYRTKMAPILEDLRIHQEERMALLKAKLEPMVEDLKKTMEDNVSETRAALFPVLEDVKGFVEKRLLNLQEALTPYMAEYQEQLSQAYRRAQAITEDDVTALKGQILTEGEKIKTSMGKMADALSTLINQN